MNLIQNHLQRLAKIEKGDCWYIVKQETSFWKQCYFVSILDRYKVRSIENWGEALSYYLESEVQRLNRYNQEFALSANYRALKVACYYGLLTQKVIAKDEETTEIERIITTYEQAVITPVYNLIKELTQGRFEQVELYQDLINSQIEKIFISSYIDEKSKNLRRDYKLYPCLFLYKILVELGKATGEYQISFAEYKYIVQVQHHYSDFLNTLVLINESRYSKDLLQYCKAYKENLDNRFHLVLAQLGTLEIDQQNELIRLKKDKLEYVQQLLTAYERDPLACDQEHENYLVDPTPFLELIRKTNSKDRLQEQAKFEYSTVDFLQEQSKQETLSSEELTVQTTLDFSSEPQLLTAEEQAEKERNLQQAVALSKPFLILSGVSGTGKSRFVRQQAEATGVARQNYSLVAVRPDWITPSALIGNLSRITGRTTYITTPTLDFILKAWLAIAKVATFNLSTGQVEIAEEDFLKLKPFWLCLDEMNLAPVEQYFANYLVALETRNLYREQEKQSYFYSSSPLVEPQTIKQCADFFQDCGISSESPLANYFRCFGIGLPFNLIVVGTVNMDETTYSFSRKVLDRALSLDFSEVFPNDFNQFFEPQYKPKTLTFSHASDARKLLTADSEFVPESIHFLTQLNNQLAETKFKLGYRALNELLLAVASFKPQNRETLESIWDEFVMTKLLPRIDGDRTSVESLLLKLESTLANLLPRIWKEKRRVDLYRETITGEAITNLSCLSKEKIREMKARLEQVEFTNFWS